MDRLENIKISENVTLRVVRTDKFKTIFIGASFLWPLLKEDHTKNALIPRVLLRGCEEYPDMRSLSGKLADMYGASLSPFVSKKGDLQEFGLYMSFISDRYALKNEKIEKDAVELLLKVLFSPALENGAFLSKTIDSEKKNLEDTIKNRINDKIPYSMARCVEEMAGKESYGIFEEGSLIDLPQINPKNLYEHYEEILKNAPIEIFVYGELSKEGVNEIVDALRQKKSLRRSIKSKVAQPKEKAIEVVEKIPAEQSKL